MKRFLKWTAVLVLLACATPVCGLLFLYGQYCGIVRQTPGALRVNATPGMLGALVNPFSATGGLFYMCGHNTPAATTPFGLVRLGPDTRSLLIGKNGLNRAGYYYGDNQIIGFSHTRLVGADALEGGVFRVFPTTEPRVKRMRRKDRSTRFTHADEKAFPGYYGVWLPKENVLAELTATPRTGVHRYTFRTPEKAHLLLDVTSAFGDKRCENGVVMAYPDRSEIEGSVKTIGSFSGRYGGLDVYFAARFSAPFESAGLWNADNFSPNATETAGNDIGVDLAFPLQGPEKVVEMKLALSCVSIQNARKNLDAEAAGRGFDDILAAAREAWEEKLSRIRVQGGTETQRRIFYTALYRAFTMPTTFTDVTGEYMGFDRAVHKAEGFQYYTDFSLWDTFRTVHPLYNLAARQEARDMMISLTEMAKAGGAYPRWPSGCGYTNCMFGTPADIAVSEAYLKGIQDFDIAFAYQNMRQVATSGVTQGCRFGGRNGLKEYLSMGYCPSEKMSKAVSATLEYAWADHSLSLLAKALGHEEDALEFDRRAQFYRNLWNPETMFFQPKDSSGAFSKNFKPLLLSYVDFDRKFTDDYVEGSAMQWRWSVPHDPDGLIALFPNPDAFIRALQDYMLGAKPGLGSWNPGGNYWHGNEPYIHAAYLFNTAGRPDLTQKWVRWILDTKYSDDYVGLDGNDDGGTLSAWYVLSALGVYPIAGTTRYELGAPLFQRADVRIGGNVLTIIAENHGPKNCYAEKIWLNDTLLDRSWITHDDIAQGGTLRFAMNETPAPAP